MNENKGTILKMINGQAIGQIYKTNDYAIFKLLVGNRELFKPSYRKIIESMKEEQLVIPILVNENFEIIDGQHRFTACKELGLPVYFYIVSGYKLDEVKRANTASSNWSNSDYLDMYIKNDVEIYKKIDLICKERDITLHIFIKIIATLEKVNTIILTNEFIEGKFKEEYFENLIKVLDSLELFNFINKYKQTSFIVGYLKLYMHPDYDHEHMKNKIEKYPHNIKSLGNYDECLSILCNKIYSFGINSGSFKPIYYSVESGRFHR